jgi:hypothetical protein
VITNDWDKRMQTLSQETEKQLQAHHEEWETRRRELEALRDQQKADIIADYQRRTDALQERSDDRLRDVAERGEADIIRMQEEWHHALADKRRDNDSLRESLRQLSQDNQKYCSLQYRISTAMELLQKAKCSRKLSAEARAMITMALEFHALFDEYHPEKTKLDHLIKANLTLQRCSVVPILGEGSEGSMTRAKSPAARSQSPVVGAARSVGRSASRANSPSVGRRANSITGGADSPHAGHLQQQPPPRVGSLRSVSPRAGSSGSTAASLPTTRRL